MQLLTFKRGRQFLETLLSVGYTWTDPTEAKETPKHGNLSASYTVTFGKRANCGKDRWQKYITSAKL